MLQTVVVYNLVNCLSKMFAAVLFVTGLYTAVGFNIYTTPVRNFTNDDRLFGQTIIKSKEGVFVPSPVTGDVFRCTEEICSRMNAAGVIKGLSPIASVASRWSEDDTEQLLVCNQVENRREENFNGKCTHLSDNQEKNKIYPDQLVLQLLEKNATTNTTTTNNNNNNNNNNNQGSQESLHRDHWRKRRAVQNDMDEDEDEDAGTEIAIVLDGSGSIDMEDFERAKDFIYSVMNNVWTTCFGCNFAIVQFGREIRTELSLNESDDSRGALEKVQNIMQIGKITKTASALYHVLTDVFVPEHGSKTNAKKMIILLSDGKMAGDNRNLTDVLNMTQMEGVTRYAIGVGPEVLNKPAAIEEMITIAGREDRFFKVSNYDALKEILSSLEKSIIGIEGIQKGAGFQFELAEAGFSSHFIHDGSILFGAVGAYDWSGGIILKKNNKEDVEFFNATHEEPRFSYLGYSVTSAYADSKTLYISGAPRYNLTGAVFIFDGTNQDLLQGNQVGSYFGSVLCALDINNDRVTDYLLVGAPHFHVKGEEGKVLVYKLNNGKFEEKATLSGQEKYTYARFGSAIADIGDIDGNGFRDVAVGAPLEADNAGSVYIYNGFRDGIDIKFSQRITPSDFGDKLVHFGQAVSVMSLSNKNSQPLISVGSQGAITVFQTIPVIIIKPKITVDYEMIALDKQTNDESSKFNIRLQICFNSPKGEIKSGELPIYYHVDLDSDKEQKRLVHDNPHEEKIKFTLTEFQTCTDLIELKYMGCSDCFSPIKIRVNFTLAPSPGLPVRVLDTYSPQEAIKEIAFVKECISQHCKASISLSDSKPSPEIFTLGKTPSQTLEIKFNLMNSGDSSYMTTLTLTYPEILSFKKSEGGTCENINDERKIVCKLLHPIFKRNAQTSLTIAWQDSNSITSHKASITAQLTGGNNSTEVLDFKTYHFTVKKALDVKLSGTAKPARLNITEGEESNKQMLYFNFKLLGENKYNAKINVKITIEKRTHKTDMSIESVEPKNCSQPSDKNVEKTYQILCTMTELHDINIEAQTHIHDIRDNSENITASLEITFDESIYEAQNQNQKRQTIGVSLIKLTVVKNSAYIVGSAIGGFLLLIVIIIILIKCGFFRRRHKMDRT